MSITSTEEIRVASASGASKGQKDARYDLIPVFSLHTLAVHYGIGAQKYPPLKPISGEGLAVDNWRLGFAYSSAIASLERHLAAFKSGEYIDPETGSPHLAAIAWHSFTLMEFENTPGFPEAFDDRQQNAINPLGSTIDDVREAVARYGGVLPDSPAPGQIAAWEKRRDEKAREAAGE